MSDADIIKDARDLQSSCEDLEGENRRQAEIDAKFVAGGDDQWDAQWMQGEVRDRTKAPKITVNQLPQYIHQVVNDIKQNRPSIKARPVDDKADIELADIYGGIFRHTRDQGKAEMATDIAVEHAVTHGLGWYRMVSDYADPMSFDQEVCYRGIDEPQNVYHNDFRMPDGADLTHIVLVTDMSEAAYESEFGEEAAKVSWGESEAAQVGGTIAVAECYTLEERKDTLLMLEDGQLMLESDAKKRIAAGMQLPSPIRERETSVKYVQWRKLNGAEVLDERKIEIPFIPVIPVQGICMRIDGKPVRFGLVRQARDPQRYYNWLKSAEAEYLQNAPKSPYTGPAEAFEPYQTYWARANEVNFSYLPFAHLDKNGNPLPPIQRTQPAQIPSGLMQAELTATDDIKKSLGMYSAAIGARGNATSGKQELAQQREADVGTFHFADNLAKSVLREGRILMAWIPKLMQRRQIARIIGLDDEPQTVRLTQALPNPVTKVRTQKGIERVYNLGVGKYDVTVSVGPSFTTKRQEAAAMMTEMVRADPTLMAKAGDIIVKNYDIPGADALVTRLKAFLPPQILQAEQEDGDEQNPEAMRMALAQVQQAQAQIQQRAQMLQEIEGKMTEKEREIERSTQEMAQERTQLQAEKQVLEARAKEIEQRIALAAERAANQVREAAGTQEQPTGDLERVQQERRDLARDKREAGLEFDLRMARAEKQLQAMLPSEKDDDGEEPMEAKEKAAETANGAAPIDLGPIQQALAMLLERPQMTAEDVSKMVAAESEKTRKVLQREIANSRTVRVIPEMDEDGNIVGGDIVQADGKRRKVDMGVAQ